MEILELIENQVELIQTQESLIKAMEDKMNTMEALIQLQEFQITDLKHRLHLECSFNQRKEEE